MGGSGAGPAPAGDPAGRAVTDETRQLVDYCLDRLEGWRVSTRRLFGTTALYRDGLVFALVWRGAVYFKVDAESRADYEAARSHPFTFTTRKGEEAVVKSYWLAPDEVVEDDETFLIWAERACLAAREAERR